MIREKGEALSPVKINRSVWSNSAMPVEGLFTVAEHLLPVTVCRLGEGMEGAGRGEEGGTGGKEGRSRQDRVRGGGREKPGKKKEN